MSSSRFMGKAATPRLLGSLIGALETNRSASARALFAADWLCCAEVPYSREPIEIHGGPDRTLDVCSFDCATFVYAVNALVAAKSLDSYFNTLHAVRYSGPPAVETLIHYALNVLRRFEVLGIIREVELSEPHLLRERSVLLDDRGGGNWFIPQAKIGDSNRGCPLRFRYTPTSSWTRSMPEVRSGDTVVFVSSKPQHEYPGIVGHLGIAYRTQTGDVTMYHCSKMPVGAKDGPCAGVSLLRHWDECSQALRASGEPRTIAEYLNSNPDLFSGAAIFRPVYEHKPNHE